MKCKGLILKKIKCNSLLCIQKLLVIMYLSPSENCHFWSGFQINELIYGLLFSTALIYDSSTSLHNLLYMNKKKKGAEFMNLFFLI